MRERISNGRTPVSYGVPLYSTRLAEASIQTDLPRRRAHEALQSTQSGKTSGHPPWPLIPRKTASHHRSGRDKMRAVARASPRSINGRRRTVNPRPQARLTGKTCVKLSVKQPRIRPPRRPCHPFNPLSLQAFPEDTSRHAPPFSALALLAAETSPIRVAPLRLRTRFWGKSCTGFTACARRGSNLRPAGPDTLASRIWSQESGVLPGMAGDSH